jgi:hypothetical protein
MIVVKSSKLKLPLHNGLSAKLLISGSFHTLNSSECALIFLNASLLHILIDGYRSLDATVTKSVLEKIRQSETEPVGDVAYILSNGDVLRTMNPVSALAAINRLGSLLPALVSLDALKIFRRQYLGKFLEELPHGWELQPLQDC